MQTKTMSVAEALLAIKATKAKIDRLAKDNSNTIDTIPACLVKGAEGQKPTVIGYRNTVAEAISGTSASLQSLDDLLKYYKGLRSAVTQSNISTWLTIGDRSETVQSWIDEKTLLEYRLNTHSKLQGFYETLQRQMKKENDAVTAKVDTLRAQLLQANLSQDVVAAQLQSIIDNEGVTMLNEAGFVEYLKLSFENISLIRDRLDFELNRSNVSTSVTVTW